MFGFLFPNHISKAACRERMVYRMMAHERILAYVSQGGKRIRSQEWLCRLLRRLGFAERIRGSHHIFTKEGVEEILNLQPKGRQAKPYQVKQVRGTILKYRLGGTSDAS